MLTRWIEQCGPELLVMLFNLAKTWRKPIDPEKIGGNV